MPIYCSSLEVTKIILTESISNQENLLKLNWNCWNWRPNAPSYTWFLQKHPLLCVRSSSHGPTGLTMKASGIKSVNMRYHQPAIPAQRGSFAVDSVDMWEKEHTSVMKAFLDIESRKEKEKWLTGYSQQYLNKNIRFHNLQNESTDRQP